MKDKTLNLEYIGYVVDVVETSLFWCCASSDQIMDSGVYAMKFVGC